MPPDDARRRLQRSNHLNHVTLPTLMVGVPVLVFGGLACLLGLLWSAFFWVGIPAVLLGLGILWWGRPR